MTLATIARGFQNKLKIVNHTKNDLKLLRLLDRLDKRDKAKSRVKNGAVNLILVVVLLVISILVIIASWMRG